MSEVLDYRGKPRVVTEFHDESLTDQSQYELTRIDKIMGRYGVTGLVDHLADVDEMFLDVTELPEDYQAVLEYSANAVAEFMKLPSKVRELFSHDVAVWLDAAHDEELRNEILAKAPGELARAGIRVAPGGGAEPAGGGPATAGDPAPASEET